MTAVFFWWVVEWQFELEFDINDLLELDVLLPKYFKFASQFQDLSVLLDIFLQTLLRLLLCLGF